MSLTELSDLRTATLKLENKYERGKLLKRELPFENNMKKSLFRKILFFLSVPKCVCCGEKLDINDNGLCKKCMIEYDEIKLRNCSRCSKILSECSCSNNFLKTHYTKKLIKVFRYVKHHENIAANSLIYSLKRDNREDVLSFLSCELEAAVRVSVPNPEKYIVTNVPRRRKAIKRYGIDHAALLAKALAKRLGCRYESYLKSKSKLAQKTTYGEQRISNAEFDIKAKDLKGKSIIIVDDICTTGASIGSCAALLHSIGVKEIIGAVISVAFKDEYIPFEYVKPIF